MFKSGDIVELIENTGIYKKGQKARVIECPDPCNPKKMFIRYFDEKYEGYDVDVALISAFHYST